MANLTIWRPITDLVNFGDVFERFFARRSGYDSDLFNNKFWTPAVEVVDKKDRLIVKAELPGIDKKDVKVNVENDYLTISGETKNEHEVKEKEYYYSERSYGSFSRSIPLPVEIETGKIKAAYKKGVLTIDLPKSEKAKPKEIDVKVE